MLKAELRLGSEMVRQEWRKLTLKHWETHGCIVSTAATDALVLKFQVISTLNADIDYVEYVGPGLT